MGLLIDIKKDRETEEEVIYFFSTVPEDNSGTVSINKKTGECSVIEEPEFDKEGSELSRRVFRVLVRHWIKGEFPEQTCWAS